MDLCTLLFALLYLYFSALLCWHDIRSGLLPDRFTCPLLWSGILYHLHHSPSLIADTLWGAIAGYGSMSLFYWGYRVLRQREGLGYGDVKYLAALGACHGWQQLPLLLIAASVMACVFVAAKALWNQTIADIKNPLPFGPFMGAAGFIQIGVSTVSLRL
ncbi:A24 family peptidase [Kluyvera cryocrescens]|uniref:A24 family peptidase n=1 Tax=Kluyvera cryocrescens TaxID=580 RepID=A0AAW9CE30_KLUCR|nr:A24 family peptidase [Kluyvera cryocrescens]MDW3780506.1 A24 family peptidase [Kluyvera cryocrescens]